MSKKKAAMKKLTLDDIPSLVDKAEMYFKDAFANGYNETEQYMERGLAVLLKIKLTAKQNTSAEAK